MPPPKKPEDLTPAEARASAMRILARREHSVAQIRRKLAARGHDAQTTADVVESLTEAGWQSDARFAETLARSRANQGYGPLRIRAELKEARVPDEQIRAAFAALDCDFAAEATRVRTRRFGAVPDRGPEWQKQYRFLATRGFDSEQIKAAMNGDAEPNG
ncbi:MAG: regulatory protein RecX [Panacagrimonas sp.]